MEFNQRIDIQGRIDKIRLEQVAELAGYFPGNYYTNFVYKDERGNIWWLQRDDMVSTTPDVHEEIRIKNETLGNNWKDWNVVPSDIINELRKQWDNQ